MPYYTKKGFPKVIITEIFYFLSLAIVASQAPVQYVRPILHEKGKYF